MKNTNTSNGKETSSPNAELLQLQTNVQETENNSQSSEHLIERERVDNTPFTIVTIQQGTFIAISNRRVTDYITKEECYNLIKEKPWSLIIESLLTILELRDEMTERK